MERGDIMNNTFIGNRLRIARENAGFRQIDVKEKAPISNKNLSNWENGTSQPSIQDLFILADLYEISIDELLGHKPLNIHAIITGQLTNTERRFILKIRSLNDEGQLKALEYIDDLSGNTKYTEKEAISV